MFPRYLSDFSITSYLAVGTQLTLSGLSGSSVGIKPPYAVEQYIIEEGAGHDIPLIIPLPAYTRHLSMQYVGNSGDSAVGTS